MRMSLAFVSTLTLLKIVLGYDGQLQKCIKEFLTTEYHFIQIVISANAMKCIYAFNKVEFEANCPDTKVALTENLELKMKSEISDEREDFVIFYHEYIYEDHPNREIFYHEINIAEQLELHLKDCRNLNAPFQSVILQVLRRTNRRNKLEAEYGFLFFVQNQTILDILNLFGYIMVPYMEMDRSIIIGEYSYNKAVERREVTNHTVMFNLLSCSLDQLWKASCESPKNSRANYNKEKTFMSHLWILLFFISLTY